MKSSILIFGCVFLWLMMAAAASAQDASAGEHNSDMQQWGTHGISLKITAQGATVEFDCAQGEILQPIRPNAAGEFSVPGTFTRERGGPVQKNATSTDVPAIYKGTIHGDIMELQVVLSGGSQVPPFTLTRGSAGRLVRCR